MNPEAITWYLDTVVFPKTMMFSDKKISASGQEIGGGIMFKRRLGFSGTPSALLPIEFGGCQYERGDDGKMVHFLSSPTVVKTINLEDTWDPKSLLKYVGRGEYNALIDVGALVTGMSNYEIACFLLHRTAMRETIEGIVFLDRHDRKRVAMRAPAGNFFFFFYSSSFLLTPPFRW